MRVFVTGATGFIGSAIVQELINTGHHVVGLSRSDAGAEVLTRAGAEVFRGDVNDLDRLRTAVETADGVIHTAFNHDFSNLKKHSENDRKVIETLGEVLAGSDWPLVIVSGTGLVARSKTGDAVVETDDHVTSVEFPRAATEEAVDALIAKGGRSAFCRGRRVGVKESGHEVEVYNLSEMNNKGCIACEHVS
jgi:nucleoside-diphosphate-sugar epimerase